MGKELEERERAGCCWSWPEAVAGGEKGLMLQGGERDVGVGVLLEMEKKS